MDFSIIQAQRKAPTLEGVHRALFIQPHPDDNEIAAAGTMAKLIHQGAEVFVITVTDDRFCDGAPDGKETIRQREELNACETLGAKHVAFLGFADKTTASVHDISKALVPYIRELRPDAVFSCDPTLENECHSDHIKVGYAVRFAVMDASCDFYPPREDGKRYDNTWHTPILGQYYTDKANTSIDISEFYEKKCAALSCHKSQGIDELMQMVACNDMTEGEHTRVEHMKLLRNLHLHCFTSHVE